MSSLKDLKAIGAFVKDELVPKEISFTLNGEEHKAQIHVRRLSIGLHEQIFLGGGDEGNSRTAKLISEAVRLGEGGAERISFAEAYTLHPSIANAMAGAIWEVNTTKSKN